MVKITTANLYLSLATINDTTCVSVTCFQYGGSQKILKGGAGAGLKWK